MVLQPPGSLYRSDDRGITGYCHSGLGRPVLVLVPTDGWWIANWTTGARLPLAIDICTPPKLIGDEWTYTDLELDPYRTDDGVVGTDDWEEFVEACEAELISPDEERAARQTTAELERMIQDRVEPFGDVGFDLLAEMNAKSLAPLTNLDRPPYVRIEERPHADLELRNLLDAAFAELVARYGAEGRSNVHADGRYLVVSVDDVAVGCGAVQPLEPGIAELKRMYVRPSARGRGIARTLLTALERFGFDIGFRILRLATGIRQPAAIALYESHGYALVDSYGRYRDAPLVRCYEKPLVAQGVSG